MRLLFVLAGLCLTLAFSTAQAQTTAGNEARPLAGNRTRFLLSDIDVKLVKEFNGAWQQCVLGTRNTEAVVLVLSELRLIAHQFGFAHSAQYGLRASMISEGTGIDLNVERLTQASTT